MFANHSQPPDFSGLDEVMSLAQAYHLRVVADLVTIPTWMADCATPASDTSRCATADLPAYASVISQIVSHADPVIRDWEVWNEPDTAAFFNGTPQQYAFMLRTAHDAIKAVDPGEDVLLGGISGIAGMDWLGQVFATPGADAAHAFDTATVHERGDLWSLASDLAAWRRFLAADGFTGPLWVTEHGYPSDPAYQYDPGYTGGEGAQAAYLAASIPTLVDAGAAEVFVTERDNLGGQFASEGVLGGDVSDPPVADPEIVPKPSFAVVQAIAECYEEIGRDCPGARPAASPSAVTMPPVPPGHTSGRQVIVTDPGAEPILLGAATLAGPGGGAAGRGAERVRRPGSRASRELRRLAAVPAASRRGDRRSPGACLRPGPARRAGQRRGALAVDPAIARAPRAIHACRRRRWRRLPAALEPRAHQPAERRGLDRARVAVGPRRAAISHPVRPMRPRHAGTPPQLSPDRAVHPHPGRRRPGAAHAVGRRIAADGGAAPRGVSAAHGQPARAHRQRGLRDRPPGTQSRRPPVSPPRCAGR